jgi:uncharacterized protein
LSSAAYRGLCNLNLMEIDMAMNETRNERVTAPLSPPLARTSFGPVDWIALLLMIVGGINWGLVGLFNFDLVAAIFGSMTTVSRIVYVLVALAALYGIALAVRLGTARRVA